MQIRFLSFFIFLFFQINLFSQTFEWAQGFGDWVNEEVNGLAHDSQGNFYVAGFYSNGTQFGTYEFDSSGSYLVKFSSSGEILFKW